MKPLFTEVKIKDQISNPAVQDALRDKVTVPSVVIIKQVRNPFENQDTHEVTQKIHAVSGNSLIDMVELDFTLTGGQTIDGKSSINKKFKIVDYNFTLNANMRGGNFNGYSATGLKLLVTKIEPVEESK
ncbi:hypothetical protein [Enterococcus massiliensis]|uniref:hypothetical protein n=1 Tax=Enterococcus massiliensis TaxID=1640685 RepID=UPI00065DFC89|nr:hypothetical protein [Enterococcus massiliensis]